MNIHICVFRTRKNIKKKRNLTNRWLDYRCDCCVNAVIVISSLHFTILSTGVNTLFVTTWRFSREINCAKVVKTGKYYITVESVLSPFFPFLRCTAKLFRFKMNLALNVPRLPDVGIKFKNCRCDIASAESTPSQWSSLIIKPTQLR